MGIKKGEYTLKELDDAIESETDWAKRCEAEGSTAAAAHFNRNVGYLSAAREREVYGE